MKTIGSVLKRLLLALGGSASEDYLNDITLVDRIAELAENGQISSDAVAPSIDLTASFASPIAVQNLTVSLGSANPNVVIHNNRLRVEISKDKKWIRVSGFLTYKTDSAAGWKYFILKDGSDYMDFVRPTEQLQYRYPGIIFDQNKFPAYMGNSLNINIFTDGNVNIAAYQGTSTSGLENTIYLFGTWFQIAT